MSRPHRRGLILASLALAVAAPALAGFAGTDLFLPMVGRQVGVYPSNWYTTIWIYNPGGQVATARIYFLERGVANPLPLWVDVPVGPGDTERIENVLETLFSRQAYGALRITSAAQKLVVTSRVYSKEPAAGETDSFGQDFAGVPASFAIGLGERAQVLGVHETIPTAGSEHRYNFGFVETTGATATVRVRAYDGNNAYQGFKDFNVLAYSQRQVAFKDHFPGVSTENSRLDVEVIAGSGKVIAYGSMIANGSQDPTTFEMQYKDSLIGGGLTSVAHDATLTGDGTAGSPLGIADGGVASAKLADGAVTLAKIATTSPPAPAAGAGASALVLAGPKVLTTDGSALSWQPPGPLVLPWSGQTAQPTAGAAFEAINVGGGLYGVSGAGANGVYGNGSARGVWGSSASGIGVDGATVGGTGVRGASTAAIGVEGTSGSAIGVHGRRGAGASTPPPADAGVWGDADVGDGVYGASATGDGVVGQASGGGYGVVGGGPNTGVYGSGGSQGVIGSCAQGRGVAGDSVSGYGVHGVSQSGTGVRGDSTGEYGVHGRSSTGDGVFGEASAANKSGVYAVNPNPSGWAGYFAGRVGITGDLSCSGCVSDGDLASGAVTKGKLAATGAGSAGQVLGTDGAGLVWQSGGGLTLPYNSETTSAWPTSAFRVVNNGNGGGLEGYSSSGSGVRGFVGSGASIGGPGDTGVIGMGAGSAYGVVGTSASGTAIYGYSEQSQGTAVHGVANQGVMASAVYGVSAQGRGVHGRNDNSGNFGFLGSPWAGVSGQSESGGYGVWGIGTSSDGVRGESSIAGKSGVYGVNSVNGGYGVFGRNTGAGTTGYVGGPYGAWGESTANHGTGVKGVADNGSSAYGVWGVSASGYAGFFSGKGYFSGFLEKPGGGFKIDHPLDPAGKYLYHSFVESPDMMNIYNGNVVTDEDGLAIVELPAWFETLNRDFRYQLTVIGRFAQAIIESELADGRFTIRTNLADVKVSWQVTGIRHDPWAEANRPEVEAPKPPAEAGTYLHPELYGQPPEKSVESAHHRPD